MKLQVYEEISSAIRAEHSVEWLGKVAARYPKTILATLNSIGSQIRRRDTLRSLHTHRRPNVMMDYYKRYLASKQDKESKVLLSMAEEVSLAPTLLARIILEKHANESRDSSIKPQINSWIKNPASIPDTHLAEEVQHCTQNDPDFGPDAVEERRQIGNKYEAILKEKLDAHELCYLGEDAMRKLGYDKTPDAKMELSAVTSSTGWRAKLYLVTQKATSSI
ncbi:CDAN1-interacting nuclease 1-like isoform X2 [Corticium candelabrum]|uniref:CDAN1-interacting nuclease 1-like isoform X2 n=1 Tax=Corticium candelabrum TaxID=121492 RepID=UPI002E258B63|nr:CDAN1-interacting nuclease 1-like isoform X2 [Corticium candelabrum]